ncbi:hypothetical protein C8J56DRAFT_1116538 [Mycena floridula]|nr:hypothetical protein C8J56DRAFT_1116538 [Mycena floridula]
MALSSISPLDTVGEGAFIAMIIGLMVQSFLAGTATLQTAAFFWVNRKDPIGHKCAVAVLWSLALFQTTSNAASTYLLSAGKGRTSDSELSWTFRIQAFVIAFVVVITQLLYVLRLWALLKTKKTYQRWIPPFLFVLLAIIFAFALISGVELWRITSISTLEGMPRWSSYIALAGACSNDILIALALVYAFATGNTNLTCLMKRRTGSSITMFSAYVFNTGVVAAVFSGFALLCFVSATTTPLFFIALGLLPQAMMNARLYFHCATHLPSVFLPTTVDLPQIPYSRHSESEMPYLRQRPSCSPSTTSASHFNPPLPKLTINEVGLPLFPATRKSVEQSSPVTDVPLEILVQTRKEKTVTKYRPQM